MFYFEKAEGVQGERLNEKSVKTDVRTLTTFRVKTGFRNPVICLIHLFFSITF